jgi:hypothetical protein
MVEYAYDVPSLIHCKHLSCGSSHRMVDAGRKPGHAEAQGLYTARPFQDAPLRTFNGTAKNLSLNKGTGDASTLTSYFSPNTLKQRSKTKGKVEAFPVDMKDLNDRVMAAKNAVLFLAFIPGRRALRSSRRPRRRQTKTCSCAAASHRPTRAATSTMT